MGVITLLINEAAKWDLAVTILPCHSDADRLAFKVRVSKFSGENQNEKFEKIAFGRGYTVAEAAEIAYKKFYDWEYEQKYNKLKQGGEL